MVLRELFASFGVDFDDAALERGAKRVDQVAGGLRNLATNVAGQATTALEGIAASNTRVTAAMVDSNARIVEAEKGTKAYANATEEAKEATEKKTKADEKATETLTGLVEKMQKFAAAFAAGLAVHRLASFATDTAHLASEIQNLSDQTGLSTSQLQAWGRGAAGLGIPIHGVEQSLAELTKRFTEAAEGSKAFAPVFRKLGIAVRDEHGHVRETQDVLLDFMDALAAMPNQAERATYAMIVMGADGRKLLPILQKGRAGFEELEQAVGALGGGLSQAAITAGTEFGNATNRLETALLGLRSRIAVEVLPALTAMTERASALLGRFFEIADRSNIVKVTLAALGAIAAAVALKMLIAWGATLAPFLALGLAIGLVILVVEDLWTSMTGGKGILADVAKAFDSWARQTTTGPLAEIAEWWVSLVDIIDDAKRGVQALGNLLAGRPIHAGIDFGDDTVDAAAGRMQRFLDTHGAGRQADLALRVGPGASLANIGGASMPAAATGKAVSVEQQVAITVEVADPNGIYQAVSKRLQNEQRAQAKALAEDLNRGGD